MIFTHKVLDQMILCAHTLEVGYHDREVASAVVCILPSTTHSSADKVAREVTTPWHRQVHVTILSDQVVRLGTTVVVVLGSQAEEASVGHQIHLEGLGAMISYDR